ncbi:hypothetical protein AVEN_136674-1, partial [Araneus ventricosus]
TAGYLVYKQDRRIDRIGSLGDRDYGSFADQLSGSVDIMDGHKIRYPLDLVSVYFPRLVSGLICPILHRQQLAIFFLAAIKPR